MSTKTFPHYRAAGIDLYRTRRGWRWRLRDTGNHRILAASSEAFSSAAKAANNLRLTFLALRRAAESNYLAALATGAGRKPLLHRKHTSEQPDLFDPNRSTSL